jgi:transposase
MDANVRPHRACIVQNYLQQEAIELLPWPDMSPGMNPVEHLWNYLGTKSERTVPQSVNTSGTGDFWYRNGNSTLNTD